ncbi:MAG: type II secretion system F family protein [Candidatus Melainabacteria bacterium]|nr:type II secretion system F family protein [Candidatus Melainabacteria bacterium]
MNTDTLLFLIIAITLFLLFMGVYKLTAEKKVQAREQIQSLLGDEAKGESVVNRLRQKEEALLKKRSKDHQSFKYKLENKLERANLLIRTDEFMMISAGAGALVGLFFQFGIGTPIILSILLGGVGICLPYLYIHVLIWLRMRKAAAQFADVLDAMVNCFKTGYGFNKAVQVIMENYDDPWGTEYGKMFMELSLGAPMDDVLTGLARRVPSPDVDLFVTSILIQKETGGNMAELLNNLSHTIRERYKLFRKVAAISAQGKLSAIVVGLVPFFLMGLMFVLLRDPVVKFVTNPIGIFIMVVAAIWMGIGIFVLYKIVQIEV